jgi:hypothetical protein
MAIVALAARPKTRIKSTRQYGIVSFFYMAYILFSFDGKMPSPYPAMAAQESPYTPGTPMRWDTPSSYVLDE